MIQQPIRAVLFDLDGTLLDTAPDLVGALNYLRVQEGLPAAPVSEYRQYVSQGALGLIRAGLPAADQATEARWRESFLGWYAEHSMDNTGLFDGVESLLDELDARAIPWGLVTNKPEFLTFPIVQTLGWRPRAAFVVCGDTLKVNKPDPAPVRLACELINVAPEQTIMVGDDPRDLDAGEAAGTHIALAGYGYGAEEVLASGRPLTHVLREAGDLLNVVNDSGDRLFGSL